MHAATDPVSTGWMVNNMSSPDIAKFAAKFYNDNNFKAQLETILKICICHSVDIKIEEL